MFSGSAVYIRISYNISFDNNGCKHGKALDNSTVKGTGQTEGHSKSRMTFVLFVFL